MNRSLMYIGAGLLLLLAVGGVGYIGMSIAEKFIANREGFSAVPYKDQAGLWTIGYGHKIKPGEHFPNPITQQEGLQLLQQDMADAMQAVKDNVHVPLNQNQHAALVSLAYNIGGENFAASTLVRLLNAGDFAGAAAQFPAWDKEHINGVLTTSAGLLNRRQAEAALFNTPSTVMVA